LTYLPLFRLFVFTRVSLRQKLINLLKKKKTLVVRNKFVYRKRKRESNMKEKMFSLPILLLFLSPSLIFLANNIEELVREGRVR
jgi:hypothetical protein